MKPKQVCLNTYTHDVVLLLMFSIDTRSVLFILLFRSMLQQLCNKVLYYYHSLVPKRLYNNLLSGQKLNCKCLCLNPQTIKMQVDSNGEPMDTISMGPGMTQMMIQGPAGTEPQVLQVLSLKDATALTKAMQAMGDVKAEQAESILSDQ